MIKRIINKIKCSQLRRKIKSVGQGTQIAYGCQFNHTDKITIGQYVSIQRDCTFSGHGGIKIGDGVIIAHCVDVFSGEHNYNSDDLQTLPFDERFICEEVVIGDYAWIGCHSVIMPGVRIGEGAVIGACSVVTKDIPPLAIAVGNPARIKGYRNQEVFENLKRDKKAILSLRKQ